MRHIGVTKVVVVCLVLLIFGCKSNEVNLPDGIISKEVMIDVITDMQLLEAAHKSLSMGNLEQQAMRDTSFAIVFNKHGVTYEKYDSSLRVYTKHPQLFGEMMEQVGENLNKTQ